MSKNIVVIIGAGGIGMAIARRQGFGRTVLLADFNEQTLRSAAQQLNEAGYKVETHPVDVASRSSVQALAVYAASLGNVMQVVNTAGLSPNMAPVRKVLEVDLYGAAVVFEEFEKVIAPGGAGIIISSMAGHMIPALTPEQDHALAYTPADELLNLPFLQADAIPNTLVAYMMAKRANHLRVQAAAMSWGDKGARVNSISPGVIVTPLAQHELNSEIGDIYREMIEASPVKRMAPPEEIAITASFLLGPDAGFITGSDLLIDGGVIAAMRAGKLQTPA
ncbi:TPA: short-chain dehydrogenase [Escherichia coli]|uniref:SDR family oxidoreductase n=1 Tax=Escherichia coli TaxID=562 RepID=UPI00157BC460|nr:SDR family oxidoreductase [Escherichia coli]EFH5757331.1 SDR family oxidoreductase [Escherichia coli]EHU0062211.1 SDR family oxidoreductase [Escherichia coli]MCI5246441.1 SDR family oxidoreductase [Escherichia coli]HAH3058374.1 short-chain dehydrogenase [Escherichia coli]HCQ6744160.1 SDR family oxidoreductase [Escherichia coli]